VPFGLRPVCEELARVSLVDNDSCGITVVRLDLSARGRIG